MKNKLITLIGISMSMHCFASDSLDSFGFTEDANVRVNIKPSRSTEAEEMQQAKGFGGLVIDFYGVNGGAFLPRTSDFDGADGGAGGRNCRNGSTEKFIDHELKMGGFDVIDGFRVWVDDSDVNEDIGIIMYRACLPAFDAGNIFSEVFFSETYDTSAGEASRFYNTNFTFEGLVQQSELTDDADQCKIMMRIRFGLPATCNDIQDVSLYKIRAQLIKNDLIFKENLEDY